LEWKRTVLIFPGTLSLGVRRRGAFTFFQPGSLSGPTTSFAPEDLPKPRPSWDHLFFTLFWVTYRHELFHWHVEVFALRHEVLLRQPIYRPYVERVRYSISQNNPSEWWEEALAQAVVLDSRLVARRSGIPPKRLRKFLEPDFRTRFGDGYRHFECKSVGGVSEAHRILSAQVARVQQSHDPRSTDLALIKDNYALDDARVPGCFCFSVNDFHRFQLAPVKARSAKQGARKKRAGDR
jgi:hypothetical protein